MIKFNKSFKLLITCYLVLLQVSLVVLKIQPRIVGGRLTTIKEIPSLVRLLEDGLFTCAGTLIAPRYVVTAAHCVESKSVQIYTIVAGVTHSFQKGKRSRVDSYILPIDTVSTDVAVLKLHKRLFGSNIKPTTLCNTEWKPFADVDIFGWGKVNYTATKESNQLKRATVQVVDINICVSRYPFGRVLPQTMFCAASTYRYDACDGDSGGPALINGEFCGIISGGEGCADYNHPGVYTNIMAVRGFIRKSVNQLARADFYIN